MRLSPGACCWRQAFRAATEVACLTLRMQGHLYVDEQREFSVNEDLDTVLLNRSA